MSITVQTEGETRVIVTPQPAHQIEIRRVGVQGARGNTGLAATIAIGTTTTVSPGSSASVTNSGTPQAAVLNFEIPQGEKGDKGDKGDGGQVDTVGEGTGVEVDDTDPVNPVVGLSSAAQSSLAKADTAVQPDDLATVATSGSYNDLTDKPSLFSGDYDDLTNKPTLGTAAAANSSDFATATQGGKADTALQPEDIGVSVQGYDADTAKLNVDQAWTGAQRPTTPTALAVVSGEIDWTLASGNDFTVMLTANATLNLPSDIATHVGQKGRILITQDGTGGRTLAVNASIIPLGSEDVPEIPTDPGAMAYLAYDVISATKIVFTLTGVGE